MRLPPASPRRPDLKLAAPPGPRKRRGGRALLWAVLCLLLAACAQPRGLVLSERPANVDWRDDGSALALSRAIDRSSDYYRRLGPGTVFHYETLAYTPEELIASLKLFRDEYLAAPDAATLGRRLAERFHMFESLRVGGENLFTGYYEPELPASETPTVDLNTPLYTLPADIVKVRLARFGPGLPAQTLTGRVVDGELVPYFTREEIQAGGALTQRAESIAYVNEVDLFFLQIQGSGVLRFPDGRLVKVGYAASNGHRYTSIGAVLVRNEALPLEEVSLQSIRAWLRDNPDRQRGLLFSNPSYVFFQLREEGPLGNLRVELTPGRSIAVDQRLIPAGGLAYVITEAPQPPEADGTPAAARPVQRFMLVQDTGGAIRGHGRADLFWGSGPAAEWMAGHMRHPGRLLLLVAKKDYLPARTADGP